MHVYRGTNNRPVHIFQLQKVHYYIFDVYMLQFSFIDVFYFKLTI